MKEFQVQRCVRFQFLYLVFEWVDKDLKKYMDSVSGGMTMPLVKVRLIDIESTL